MGEGQTGIWIHPQARERMDRIAASGEPLLEALPPAEARRWADERVKKGGLPAPDLFEVRQLEAPGPAGPLTLRLYRPTPAATAPWAMFFHGGGLMVGNLDTHDSLCRAMAAASARNLVAVEYRLAPEHKFPAAPEDCLAATRWALSHCAELNADPDNFALIGESSGGTMSAVVAADLARDEKAPQPRLQVLTYPSLDMATDSPSYERFAEGFFFTRVKAQYFFSHYLNTPADADDPRASPLRASTFRGICPTLIIAAGLDPLLSEAAEYARRLKTDGVPVEFHCLTGWPHGFMFWGGTEAFEQAMAIATRALRNGAVMETDRVSTPLPQD